MSELISWLRSTIEGDKAAAEKAASGEYNGVAFTGHWTYTDGDDAVYQDGRRTPGTDGIVGGSCGCCVSDSAGRAEDLAHIARHDPRDTIARCEAELALLGHIERHLAVWPPIEEMQPDAELGALTRGIQASVMVSMVKTHARARRHRPGFKPEWVES